MSTIKLAVAAGLTVLVFATLAIVYIKGGEGKQNEIDKQNTHAATKANDAASAWRNCRTTGGVYDFNTGKCGRATAGHR